MEPRTISAGNLLRAVIGAIRSRMLTLAVLLALVLAATCVTVLMTKPAYRSTASIAPGIVSSETYSNSFALDTLFALSEKISHGAYNDKVRAALQKKGIPCDQFDFDSRPVYRAEFNRLSSDGTVAISCVSPGSPATSQRILQTLLEVIGEDNRPLTDYVSSCIDSTLADRDVQISYMALETERLRDTLRKLLVATNKKVQETQDLADENAALLAEAEKPGISAERRKTILQEQRVTEALMLQLNQAIAADQAKIDDCNTKIAVTTPQRLTALSKNAQTLQRQKAEMSPLKIIVEPTIARAPVISRRSAAARAFGVASFLALVVLAIGMMVRRAARAEN